MVNPVFGFACSRLGEVTNSFSQSDPRFEIRKERGPLLVLQAFATTKDGRRKGGLGALTNAPALPVGVGDELLDEELLFAVGGLREGPFGLDIGAEADEEDAVTLLGDSVVGGVCLVDVDAVAEIRTPCPAALFMALEASEVLIPTDVFGDWESGELHLEPDEFDVVGEGGTKKASNVFEDEGSWFDFGDGANGLREHVTDVVHASSFAAHREGLARRAASDKVNSAVLGEIDLANVGAGNLATFEGFVLLGLVESECFNCRMIPLVKSLVTETC